MEVDGQAFGPDLPTRTPRFSRRRGFILVPLRHVLLLDKWSPSRNPRLGSTGASWATEAKPLAPSLLFTASVVMLELFHLFSFPALWSTCQSAMPYCPRPPTCCTGQYS